jgi:LPXTG-site transpeptidase (sortase) family protein
MYRRRVSRRRPPFLLLIVMAILAGVAFAVIDNSRNAPAAPQATLSIPTTLPEGVLTSTPIPPVITATAIPLELAASLTAIQPTLATLPTNPALQSIPADTAIFIPDAGIYANIIQVYLDGISWDIRNLGKNVGHLEGTSWLDQGGNVVLSGHVEMADGSLGVFSKIRDLKEGNLVVLLMNGNEWRYEVTEIKITSPDDLEPIKPTLDNRLTLITCGAYDFFSDTYQERIVVVAKQAS